VEHALLIRVLARVHRRYFFDPAPAISVLEVQNSLGRPVKMVSDKGYLLVQQLEGVA
jgi:hypothetical protein